MSAPSGLCGFPYIVLIDRGIKSLLDLTRDVEAGLRGLKSTFKLTAYPPHSVKHCQRPATYVRSILVVVRLLETHDLTGTQTASLNF